MDYETVIGLEVHVQLNTASKIFCGSSAAFGGEPNEYVDPVTLGLPGALPVLNRGVVECALMLGLALHCDIREFSRFARKHYFYPDLPKGYQISQYDEPLCERGRLELAFDGLTRTIGITRIHLEEDAGKNIHDPISNTSLVDLNRAGVPLVEIVSEPDLRSPAEAASYLRTLRQIVRFLGVSDGNMEQGSLRCDANISLRPVGEMKFGTRTEIKNLNSFKFVERALEYEVARQSGVLKSGGTIVQETLLFDSEQGVTRPMRSKEESADYRYFPDPDLPPLVVAESWLNDIRTRMPKLPREIKKELSSVHGLSDYDAAVLTQDREVADFFFAILNHCGNAKAACNWLTTELFGVLKKESLEISESPVSAMAIGELIKLIDSDVISGKMAKTVFEEMFKTGKTPQTIIAEQGLQQITNDDEITKIVQQVIQSNPGQLKQYAEGNERLLGFFVGQVMKTTGGTANPKKVNDILGKELALAVKSL